MHFKIYIYILNIFFFLGPFLDQLLVGLFGLKSKWQLSALDCHTTRLLQSLACSPLFTSLDGTGVAGFAQILLSFLCNSWEGLPVQVAGGFQLFNFFPRRVSQSSHATFGADQVVGLDLELMSIWCRVVDEPLDESLLGLCLLFTSLH